MAIQKHFLKHVGDVLFQENIITGESNLVEIIVLQREFPTSKFLIIIMWNYNGPCKNSGLYAKDEHDFLKGISEIDAIASTISRSQPCKTIPRFNNMPITLDSRYPLIRLLAGAREFLPTK